MSRQLHKLNAHSHSIIRISQNSKGKGAYARMFIPIGTILCAFMGIASSKHRPSDFRTRCYIDCQTLFLYCHVNKKSTANFFNHECRDANCAIIMRQQSFGAEGIYAEKISVEWPKIETLRDIYADEEMTLNYGLGKNISIIQRYSKKTNWCLCRTCTALPQNERRRI